MSPRVLRIIAILIGVMALWTTRGEAEVKIVRPEPDNQNRLAIVSDGAAPWKLRYYSRGSRDGPFYESKLIPVSQDRMLFTHGLVLHLIDTRNGIVLGRWTFADQIEDVGVQGDKFHVQTTRQGDKKTVTITADSPSPPRWLDSLLLQRGLIDEGAWFNKDAHLETEYPTNIGPVPRKALALKDAERLIVEVEDAARRDPFSPQFAVCRALLMQDLGRKDAEAVFRRAIERPTNSYGELFAIANDLGNGAQEEWATLAFDQAYARLWQQGDDPRLIHALLPRLMLLYFPYDLRREIPDTRRAKLAERLYLMAPYVEQSPAAWKRLGAYFETKGDASNAALWRARASEAEAKSGYVWELFFYLERTSRLLAALFLAILIHWVILQRRYAPQRRLLRGGKSWWRGLLGLSPMSMTCWDRQDRQILYGLLALFWLAPGLWGALGQRALLGYHWPIAAVSGTLRAPVTEKFLRDLPPTRDRDLLMALSLQQAEKYVEAEALYLTLPDSAVKWNNLGVLQAKQGRTDEAKESFEYALRVDPQTAEAAFNLNRPVSDPWAQMHSKYLPGQKMLALPLHDVFYRVFRGSLWSLAGQSLRGPILGVPTHRRALDEVFSNNNRTPASIAQHDILYLFLLGPLTLGAIALLAPYREVTQPPGRWHWLAALVFPGTAREWGRAGGLLLTVVIWGALEYLFGTRRWTPFGVGGYFWASFGVPRSVPDVVGSLWPVDPGWFWNHGIVSLAVVVFAANAILVLRSRYRRSGA